MNPKPGNIGIDRQSVFYKNMQYLRCWYFVYFTFNIYINTWFNTIAKYYPLKFNGGSVNVNFSVKEFTGNVQFWWHPSINCLCPNAKDTVLHTCSQNCLNGLVSSWTWWSTTWCDSTNDDCLIIAYSGINFSEIVIKKHSFSFRKIHFKKSSAIFLRSQCIKYLCNYSAKWHQSNLGQLTFYATFLQCHRSFMEHQIPGKRNHQSDILMQLRKIITVQHDGIISIIQESQQVYRTLGIIADSYTLWKWQ